MHIRLLIVLLFSSKQLICRPTGNLLQISDVIGGAFDFTDGKIIMISS